MIGNKIGKLGEDIAELFLKKHGFDVLTRNYLRKYGEIDLIAEKGGITHFIEVKSVSRESGYVRPEENLHKDKLRKLSRVTESYLLSHPEVKNWVFDVCIVYIDRSTKKAEIKFLENVILPE